MSDPKTTGYYQSLRILHTALVSGVVLFLAVIFFLVYKQSGSLVDVSVDRILQVVAVLLTGISLFIGFRLFNKKILELRHSALPARAKLEAYRTACIVWWAMIEGPAFFAATGYYLTANAAFLALAIFHITILAVFMPRRDNFRLLLNLTDTEMEELDK